MTDPWERERKLVEATKEPITRKRLVDDLHRAVSEREIRSFSTLHCNLLVGL